MCSLPNQFHLPRLLLWAALICATPACAGTPFDVVKDGRPLFKPESYFAGRTHSWGLFENRSGNPTKLIHTQTTGRWEGSVFKFEQDLQIQGSKPSHRSWSIRKLDEHRYTATGTGIVGTARGEARGNALHLDFTIDAVPGNPLAHLHMSQWMYLQPDGITMINRAIASKGGVILAEVTEQFHKDR
ncbi:MAG TPA: DUF3833 family protein [Chthoniobacteraceae bacterium]|jgi:hypothetical protein|nr:DUF3833 family protein [Chthoniobacteraceae bacterium]